MPLSPPAAREHIHTRQVECRGYRRADGLWDIEGHLTDIKTYPFHNDDRGTMEAGDPIHEMWIRVTVNDSFVIQAIETVTDKSPFRICSTIAPAFQRLRGVDMRSGFLRRVKELVGGVQGCTHLAELLGPIATTAFQTIFPILARERSRHHEHPAAVGSQPPPPLLNTCHAFASDGELVRRHWPEFHTGDQVAAREKERRSA